MRSAVIEIGGTTTRAVVADAVPDGGLRLRLDRRIVLRLRQAVERSGVVGEGLQLLVVETVRRLQAECFRAGVARPHVVVTSDLAVAGDLPDLLASLRRCGVPHVAVRSALDEAGLLLQDVAVDGDVAIAEVVDRSVRFVDRDAGAVISHRRPGPFAPTHAAGARELRFDPARLDGVEPVGGRQAVVTGPVTAAVVRALWARNGRGTWHISSGNSWRSPRPSVCCCPPSGPGRSTWSRSARATCACWHSGGPSIGSWSWRPRRPKPSFAA